MIDQQQLGSLVGAVYDAGLEPTKWPETLASIRHALDAEVAALFYRDSQMSMKHCEWLALDGWTESSIAPYYAYYGSIDTRTPFVASNPAGGIYVDDKQMPFSAVEESEIYNDFFRPLGVGYGMAATLFKNHGRHGVMSVHRILSAGNFETEAVSLFEYLAPHIVRSLQLIDRFSVRRILLKDWC
jgi:hypothetical protein